MLLLQVSESLLTFTHFVLLQYDFKMHLFRISCTKSEGDDRVVLPSHSKSFGGKSPYCNHIAPKQSTKKLKGKYFPKWPNVISTWEEVCVVITPDIQHCTWSQEKRLYYKIYTEHKKIFSRWYKQQWTLKYKISFKCYTLHTHDTFNKVIAFSLKTKKGLNFWWVCYSVSFHRSVHSD